MMNIRSSPVVLNKTRRNLFDVRLNNDSLKQDLKEMWKDQVDRHNNRWNFDFEELKPCVGTPSRKRFEWTLINTKCVETPSHAMTTFGASEVLNSSYEMDEEEDEALSMPAFYKYQRRQKMNHEHLAQLNCMRRSAFAKLNNSANVQPTVKQAKRRAKPALSLIITFSENRKDTLRSAKTKTTTTATTKQQTIIGMFQQRKKKIVKSGKDK